MSLRPRLCLGVTGHRDDNPLFLAHRTDIESALSQVLSLIHAAASEAQVAGIELPPTRLHSLLADGADQMAAEAALGRGWELFAPLPFGLALNAAIGAQPTDAAEAAALLQGAPDSPAVSPAVRERAERIQQLASRAHLFELADQDEMIRELLIAKLEQPTDRRRAQIFEAEVSLRVALASRVMVEQSDLVIAIWDGTTRALVGGTGHTIQVALEAGAAVVWIDVEAPMQWRILSGPEALAGVRADAGIVEDGTRVAALHTLVHAALRPITAPTRHSHRARHAQSGVETLIAEKWPIRSSGVWHLYRRVEALFGEHSWRARLRSLRQVYQTPNDIGTGSARAMLAAARALPGQRADYVLAVESHILRRFAWSDGISSHLSDTYRGGMTASFLLGALAIISGIAYLPLADSHHKWLFASVEMAVLAVILAFTIVGKAQRWHGRWFETRRVAEYLRHAPILALLGVARAPGRWPVGTQTSWPEWYARHLLREVGLPCVVVTADYLRAATRDLLNEHLVQQRDYHIAKAGRLTAVHHNLDRLSEVLFVLAIVSVAAYLILRGGGVIHLWRPASQQLSNLFTFLGVLLPTLGGAVAGIRYFGDFERFSAISSVTAEKLESIRLRVTQLLAAPDTDLDYGRVSDLAHATDEVVVSEIESWQAVFGGKNVAVPV